MDSNDHAPDDGASLGQESEAQEVETPVTHACVARNDDMNQKADLGEDLLAKERRRDEQRNLKTRPPDDELIRLRSITFVDVYAGQDIDVLTKNLSSIQWTNTDESIVEAIAEGRKGYFYSRHTFTITEQPSPEFRLFAEGHTTVPIGIESLHCECYVIGISLVGLVVTLIIEEDEARRLDTIIRTDAESELVRLESNKFSVKPADQVKGERIDNFIENMHDRCRSWMSDRFPGRLSRVQEGLGYPSCALISLAYAKPFNSDAGYMGLLGLGLGNTLMADRFSNFSFLYLTYPLTLTPNNNVVAFYNEPEAAAHRWPIDSPEAFHDVFSSFIISEGIYAALQTFRPKLRNVRNDLDGLDPGEAVGRDIVELRDRLLKYTRELSMICSDVNALTDDSVAIWRDVPQLGPVNEKDYIPSGTTADSKKQQLRVTVTSLRSEEAELRELILITSQTTSETRGLKLQAKVNRLTTTLMVLTWVLVALTVVLVFLGIATLLQTSNPPAQSPVARPAIASHHPSPAHPKIRSTSPS